MKKNILLKKNLKCEIALILNEDKTYLYNIMSSLPGFFKYFHFKCINIFSNKNSLKLAKMLFKIFFYKLVAIYFKPLSTDITLLIMFLTMNALIVVMLFVRFHAVDILPKPV